MSEIVKLRTQAEIDDEAAAWTWRLDGEALSAADRQAFEAWLRRDPRHRRSFDDFGKVWGALDNLAEAKRDEKIATFTGASRRSVVRRNLWWGAVAATLVAALVSVVSMRQSAAVQTIATAVGQQRLVTLADGSVVTLNTNTIVEANLGRIRNVYLRKGEAHFEVAHDRSRPFLVHAGDTVVRAVGLCGAVARRPECGCGRGRRASGGTESSRTRCRHRSVASANPQEPGPQRGPAALHRGRR